MFTDFFSNLDPGQWAIIGLCAFLLGWYFLASIYNRQRGMKVYRWLRAGIAQMGKITEAQWLGSSGTGARLAVSHAEKPFRQVEASYMLETRELLPYWLLTLWRGRRDEIVLNAALRKPPKVELIAGTGKQARALPDFETLDAPQGCWIARKGANGDGLEEVLQDLLEEYGKAINQITIQKVVPQLSIRAKVNPLINKNAETFFGMLIQHFQDQGKD